MLNHINENCQKLESLGAITKKKYIAIYYRDLTKSKKGRRRQKHLEKIILPIKEEVKKASKKPGLEVIGVIHYVYDNEYEKYEDGKWKKYPCLR